MKRVLFLVAFITCCFISTPVSAQTDTTDRGLQVSSKPRPMYTEKARRKGVEGVVRLKVEFLSTGEIGAIENVTKKQADRLKESGLVDQAIIAARKIRFTPAVKNGQATTVVRTLEYTFTLY